MTEVKEVSKLLGALNVDETNKDENKNINENDSKEVKEDKAEDEIEGKMSEKSKEGVDARDEGKDVIQAQEDSAFDLLHQLENTVEVKLADQQADVNSPLYSAKSFEELGLSQELLKGIYAMKFTKPSKIQERALPLLLQPKAANMIGQSQSGTGKTAAFVLTMLSKVDPDLKEVQAICVAPSRELARQIYDVAKEMGQFTKVQLAQTIRDENNRNLGKITEQVVIGTPGTVHNLIVRKKINPKTVKILVLDEADNMLDMQGMYDHCLRIQRSLNKDCQFVLFSATFPDKVGAFAQKFAPKANEISLKVKDLSIDAIKQFYLDCNDDKDRDDKLIELYGLMTIGQSIIFVNTRANADRIAKKMTAQGYKVIALHGQQENDIRDAMIDQFRTGQAKVMVTTNVIARGIDISQVNLVINYDMPVEQDNVTPDYATYLHRIGRTGRFGKSGVAINFISNPRAFLILDYIKNKLDRPVIKLNIEDLEGTEKLLEKALK